MNKKMSDVGGTVRKRSRAKVVEEEKPCFEMKRKSATAVAKAPKKIINGENKKGIVVKGGIGGGYGKMNKKMKKGNLMADEREEEKKQRGLINNGDFGEHDHGSWSNVGGEKKQRGLINNGDFGDHDHGSWSNVGGEKCGMEVLMGSNWDYELWPTSYWSSSSSFVDEQMLWAASIWFPVCKQVEDEKEELMINDVVWEDDLWHLKEITEIPVSPASSTNPKN